MMIYKNIGGFDFGYDMSEQDIAMREIIHDVFAHDDGWEPNTTKIIRENVKEGYVCVDIGASVGYFTLLFASLVGEKGKVYSIEPTENQVPYLAHNIARNGFYLHVIPCNMAASDKRGITQVRVNSTSKDYILGIPLDDFLPEKVDFVKIDTDGSEPKVLKGMINTIERNPQLKMVIEYYPKYIRDLGNSVEELDAILEKYFMCKQIEGDYGNQYWNYYCIRK